jgi:1-phosphofructokinase
MITCVTLNPCIDLFVTIPELKTGALNLVESSRSDVAGKGVNVAVVLRELGLDARCAGINFDGNGSVMTGYLDALGIPHSLTMARGNIRTNIKVIDMAKNEMTELNSRGDAVEESVIEAFFAGLPALSRESEIVAFSGRIPKGAEDTIYRRCVEVAVRTRARVVLDAEGAPLRLALEAGPYLIKPNAYELESAFGRKITSHRDVAEICREEVISRGVAVVCVSMGGDGAMIVDGESAFFAPILDIEARGFPGAGDSMVAGVCKAITDGGGIAEMLRCGVAAASATIIREGTLLAQKADYERFLDMVRVVRVD